MAISTASLMAAALGMSGIYSTSYMAVRITADAIRGMREKFQPTEKRLMYSSSSGPWAATPRTSSRMYCSCFSSGNWA